MLKEQTKILVVDDERDILEALKTHLELQDFQVKTAETAKKALELIQSDRFHIVLTDINMPVMDGLELLEAIKAVRGETMVIMITAYTSITKVLMSRVHGAVDYILKPFRDITEIDQVIERAMSHIGRWEDIMEETRLNKTELHV